jgi:Domain of unknown function (DUF4340)
VAAARGPRRAVSCRRSQVVVALIGAVLALGGCEAEPPSRASTDSPLLLPGFAAEQPSLSEIRVVGAGNVPRVVLVKRDGAWRVPAREDWLADPGRVESLLDALAQLRGAEAKTNDPALYPRLGVGPIIDPASRGVELQWQGARRHRVLVGIEQPVSRRTYVRVEGQARSWLADRQVSLPRDAEDWLAHDLVALPPLRIATVAITPADSPAFELARTADGYRVTTGSVARPARTDTAEALVGLLAPLSLQDLARDDGSTPERQVTFRNMDGLVVEVQAWRRAGKVWCRLGARIDAPRAAAWAAQAADTGAAEAPASRAAAINARTRGYVFLLAPYPSSILLLGREQLMKGTP